MKPFETPEIKLEVLAPVDIITTSGEPVNTWSRRVSGEETDLG